MARSFQNLYPQVHRFENIFQAWRRAARGKRGTPAAATFEWQLEANLLNLQRVLVRQSYQTGPYHSFYILDPKRRLISAAPFRDRVVHHALCQVIEPLFEATFIGDSYANRLGRGTHAALDRTQLFARRHRFVLQGDVRQFFASIDHQILHGVLARKIDDLPLLQLCERIMAGGSDTLSKEYQTAYFPGDDLFAVNRPRGLPIGNLTSQFWANVYLNELDQFVKRCLRCSAY